MREPVDIERLRGLLASPDLRFDVENAIDWTHEHCFSAEAHAAVDATKAAATGLLDALPAVLDELELYRNRDDEDF